MRQRILTLWQIYEEGKERLRGAGIEEADLDAWYLLEYVTGISRASYYGNPKMHVEEEKENAYFACIDRRCRRIPLQHITGEQEFMGYIFAVNEHVLIPRQDTEVLVEEALKIIRPGMRILDMCTGSGCILISLLKMARERKHMEGLAGIGSDISEDALKVAVSNADNLSVQAEFVRSDLFDSVDGRFDMIVSNPPYIRTHVIEELQEEVRLHDPYIALDGHEDGMYYYRRIIEGSLKYIKNSGNLLFEIGHDQGKAVSDLMEEAGYSNVQVKKDLAGLDRVVSGMIR